MASFEVPELTGHERFELRSKLGKGGFGEVYEAYDAKQKTRVALKLLKSLDARALLGFKNEFRTLADLSHPNLVQLYELHVDEKVSFFTMELIDGTTVLERVREVATPSPSTSLGLASTQRSPLVPLAQTLDAPVREQAASPSAAVADALLGDLPQGAPAGPLRPTFAPSDYERVRDVLRQIATALITLHDRGKLHRDLKPSNILVDRHGRVVLLDFGLAAQVAHGEKHTNDGIEGTPFYMAPEAVRGESVPATDWYSVGVVLFEMLTGALPFEGEPVQVLLAKQVQDAVSAKSLVDTTPEDLDWLCRELLSRDPALRPTGREVLARLRSSPADAEPAPAVFIGRTSHLDALQRAFDALEQGQLSVALVHGPSAMGKSTLLQHALERFRAQPKTVVFSGKCHPHESVPFKAVDALIDAASQHLRRNSPALLEPLAPARATSLLKVFPVLEGVPGFTRGGAAAAPADPTEQRRLAFAGVRELFGKLGHASRLVLVVDDLQWGDVDSAKLLMEALAQPGAPPVLFVASFRGDEEATSPCLMALVPFLKGLAGVALEDVAVGRLSAEEATQLASAVLGVQDPAEAQRIAQEADGQPMFVAELARSSGLPAPSAQPAGARAPSLDGLLRARAAQLPADARELLKVVAIAGRPLPPAVVERVAANGRESFSGWHQLLAARWLRSRQPAGGELVEPYHDRIREAVADLLTGEERAALHLRLAEQLEARGGEDPEALAHHFHAAGDAEKTARYAELAAAAAARALAFERAGELYRLALESLPASAARRHELETALGDVLAVAGRRREAAEAYLRGVGSAEPSAALELQRRAAQQLITTGQIESGVAIIQDVLQRAGETFPKTLGAAIGQLLASTFALWVTRWRARPRKDLDGARFRLRLDSLHVATHFLGLVDPVRGMSFSKRHAAQALKLDDPARLSRALASELSYHALRGGGEPAPRELELYERARRLARTAQDANAEGFVELCAAIGAELRGRWSASLEHLARAETLFRPLLGTLWELDVIHFFRLYVSRFRGAWKETARYLEEPLASARGRGDVYAQAQFVTVAGDVRPLLDDDVARGRAELKQALDAWGHRGLDQQQVQGLFAAWTLTLYEERGRAGRAFADIEGQAKALQKAGALFVAPNLISFHELHGRAALAEAASANGRERARWLSVAKKDARALVKRGLPWSVALGHALEALALASEGAPSAVASLEAAERELAAIPMALCAAGLTWRRSQLVGGPAGAALVAEARGVFAGEGARAPERLAVLFGAAAEPLP